MHFPKAGSMIGLAIIVSSFYTSNSSQLETSPMPVTFHFDKEKKILYGKMEGVLTLNEYKTAMQTIANSETFPPESGTLWDMRKVDFTKMDRAFELHIVEVLQTLPKRGAPNVACLVQGDLGFGMGRMFESLSKDLPQNIRAFKDFDVAEHWALGNPDNRIT